MPEPLPGTCQITCKGVVWARLVQPLYAHAQRESCLATKSTKEIETEKVLQFDVLVQLQL